MLLQSINCEVLYISVLHSLNASVQLVSSNYQDACKHKTTQYWQTTRPARQTIYLIRKRPREHWDPTLWEVPLQPLPKRHKTHWDPNEWEVPLT